MMQRSDNSLARLNKNKCRALLLATASATLMIATVPASAESGWLMHGQDIQNNAHGNTDINKNNIDNVTLKRKYHAVNIGRTQSIE